MAEGTTATKISCTTVAECLSRNLTGFMIRTCTIDNECCLVLTHERLYNHPPVGPVSRVRILVREDRGYVVHILMREAERGNLTSVSPEKDLLLVCRKYAYDSQQFKFCPGIDMAEYDKMKELIRFDLKSVRVTKEPFLRVDSVNCVLWVELGSTCKPERRIAEAVVCKSCVRLNCNLHWQLKRTELESPSKKLKRQDSSSRARLSYMSPASQEKRRSNQQKDRKSLKKKVAKLYDDTTVTLDTQQADELSSITSTINSDHQEELEKLYSDAEKHGVGHLIRNVWNEDVGKEREQEQFDQDQNCNRSGWKGNRWSMITIRIALAVYVRSPAAYEALKSFGILQLPCRSTIQSYTGAFLHEPGAHSDCIEAQIAQFVLHCQKRVVEGRKESKKDGVLIFDEVKVISRLMWNSRSETLIGLSMRHDEMASLIDIYRTLDNDSAKQTSHVLQFLWRDLTSDFDIIGPYFTSSDSVDSKFTLSCVLETIKLFQCHGLSTSLLVCDGASSNLSLIKSTHGYSGIYPIMQDEDDPYSVSPFMINPFDPPNRLVCPTHQLKNMINALFSSRNGGTKCFRLDGVIFGWNSISTMFERECQRIRSGQTRMVPRLKEAHVVRDAWTKLNVTPAKIMQQEMVLSELFSYVTNNPETSVKDGSKATLQYLEACSKIFEKGFLSHQKIESLHSDALCSINDGYLFFKSWLDQIRKEDPKFDHKDNMQKKFLAWQTFDLLRIDIHGFNLFCQYFLEKHPGYFISPLRVSGSAVETLFSQFKYSAGGKLDAANYSYSRAVCLIKQVAKNHHSGRDYRDGQMATPTLPMIKKKYGKQSK